ncbi:hypothetical protein BDV93DRAFT_609646 [Ceratobasidium sp. AG-I]|nr:hypothetical protein BDV93DRAFT_609646 [Ceratobasidium sp. AG-I]
MSWYRTFLGVVIWIVMFAPILPVSLMANLAGPLPSSPRGSSFTARRLLNLESVLHPSSLGHKVLSFNTPPHPPFNIVPLSHYAKESASQPALIRHGVSYAMPSAKPPTLWSRAGGPTRQALWRGRLRWITPVLDKIIHPSTTSTGKADVAPTSTWTSTNPASPQAASGLSRGRPYADGFKSCSTESAFPSIFDVGRYVRTWIATAGARLLLAIEEMVDHADRRLQQLVSFSFDLFARLALLLSDAINWIMSVLNSLPRTLGEHSSAWNSFVRSVMVLASQAVSITKVIVKESPRWSGLCFAAGRKLVVDTWPASEHFLFAVEALPSTLHSLARRTVSDALAATRAPPLGFPSWSAACTWILKKAFVYFQLPALVIFSVVWAVCPLLHRYGSSFAWRLLPLMGYDPRSVSRELREMTRPGFWNMQDTVIYVLVQRVLQAEADRLGRDKPAPSKSEGWEWEFVDNGPFLRTENGVLRSVSQGRWRRKRIA